jgi:5'-nucleotidase/UDP-sugar diphosphatase
VGKKFEKVLGQADSMFYGRPGSLNQKTNRREETNLGRVVAQSFCETAQADICFINNGGVRENIEKGPITYKKILEIMPFGNHICRVSLKTPEIVKYLQKVLSLSKKPLHFYGIKMKFEGKKLQELTLSKKNKVLYTKGKVTGRHGPFRLASICYLTDGKRFPKLSGFKGHQDTGINDALSLKEFIEKRNVLRAKDFSDPTSNFTWPR